MRRVVSVVDQGGGIVTALRPPVSSRSCYFSGSGSLLRRDASRVAVELIEAATSDLPKAQVDLLAQDLDGELGPPSPPAATRSSVTRPRASDYGS
jgi:hypothetical protein